MLPDDGTRRLGDERRRVPLRSEPAEGALEDGLREKLLPREVELGRLKEREVVLGRLTEREVLGRLMEREVLGRLKEREVLGRLMEREVLGRLMEREVLGRLKEREVLGRLTERELEPLLTEPRLTAPLLTDRPRAASASGARISPEPATRALATSRIQLRPRNDSVFHGRAVMAPPPASSLYFAARYGT